ESLALVAPDGLTIYDSVSFLNQIADISWGRIPNGSGPWRSLKPTPSSANNTVGIDPLNLTSLSFSIFPNPASHEITIKYSNSPTSSNSFTLNIISLTGNVVFEKQFDIADMDSQYSLHIPDLPSGIYTVRIQNKNQYGIRKLVILK
ncbi:MAG TPA: T9SS type A sorting domain-containing protein, partial [Bacteroidales bacterium]|nr:T9SS type A sorting domain-containing protein [Bacteroidales bacterium]